MVKPVSFPERTQAAVRARPALFRALGSAALPITVSIGGSEYQLVETFKHDTWAATGLYSCCGKLAICKFNRQQPIAGIPMRWLGRWLGARERTFLQRLSGIAGIPTELGEVRVDGQLQLNAVAREFVRGEILRRERVLPKHFFERLRQLLGQIHARKVAYVDLHKAENVLVGEDGLPYLFDFQISYALPTGILQYFLPLRWWLTCLQQCDVYHLLKHELNSDRNADLKLLSAARPSWIRLHRMVGVPFRSLRRRLLVKLGIRSGHGSACTEQQPELAFREPAIPAAK